MSVWYKLVKNADWANHAELKQTFGSADRVGNCTVFDVGNNRFRVIGRLMYEKGKVYILKVMDHKEYDKNLWPDACGCFMPPPPPKKRPQRGKPVHRGRKGRS